MIPVIDCGPDGTGYRHAGWTGERSEDHDHIMSRRAPSPVGFPPSSEVHHIPLRARSTWNKGPGDWVWATDREVEAVLSDCRSATRHPGPMEWGLVVWLERYVGDRDPRFSDALAAFWMSR